MTQHSFVTTPPTEAAAAPTDPHVVRACSLLWWSFGTAGLSSLLQIMAAQRSAALIGSIIGAAIGMLIGYFIVRWFVSKLMARRNWMRLLVTFLNVGGILLIPLLWQSVYKPSLLMHLEHPISALVSLVQLGMNIAATVLINMPSAKLWFESGRTGANRVA